MKNVQYGVTSSEMADLLRDRAWHSLAELAQTIGQNIKPELAARAWINGSMYNVTASEKTRAARQAEQPEIQVAMGRMFVIREILSQMASDGKVEMHVRRNAETLAEERFARLLAWHCWSCGKRADNEQGDGLEPSAEERLCARCLGAIAGAAK